MAKFPGYILHADPDWVDFHLEHSVGLSFGYTRGFGAPMKNVQDGGLGFFIRRGEAEKQVYFWGNFQGDFPTTPAEAWAQFGTSLGAPSFEAWMESLRGVYSDAGPDTPVRVLRFANLRAPVDPIPLVRAGVTPRLHATKGWSIERGDVNTILAYSGQLDVPPDIADADLADDIETEEGRKRWRLHLVLERSRKLVRAAKERWFAADPRLVCECCGFSFGDMYGERGKAYIEAHHRRPLGDLAGDEIARNRIEDLAPVCANCHRMLHRRPSIAIAELADTLRAAAVGG